MLFKSYFKKGHLESAFTTITHDFSLTPIRNLHFFTIISKTALIAYNESYSFTIVVSVTTVEAAK